MNYLKVVHLNIIHIYTNQIPLQEPEKHAPMNQNNLTAEISIFLKTKPFHTAETAFNLYMTFCLSAILRKKSFHYLRPCIV